MSKKLISIIVSCALVLSLALVGVIGVSAAIDTDGRYVPKFTSLCLSHGRVKSTMLMMQVHTGGTVQTHAALLTVRQ